MDITIIQYSLYNGTKEEKLDILGFLSDVFESYNKYVDHFEQIIAVLISRCIDERDLEIKSEFFETLIKATVYKDVSHINFDRLEDSLDKEPVEYLSRCIDILSFSHNRKYLNSI